MKYSLAVLLVVLAACSPDVAADTSTSAGPLSTTSTAESSTTAVPSNSTTIPTTSTTVADTTTTEPPGNWASQPLVTTDFGALGWWDGSNWLQVDALTDLPIEGGEDYQVALIGGGGLVTGGPQTVVCEPLENVGIELDDSDALGQFPGPYGVAISAPWKLTPHPVEAMADDGTYAAFASDLLAERGLDVPDPVIKQLLTVDLEGDGIDEKIVVAEEIADGLFPAVGDYSLAFLRKVIAGTVETAVLGESLVFDDQADLFVGFTIGAVADLSGDGKMEIVLDAAYYEGLGIEVWEYVNDDLGPIQVIQQGCGA